MQSETFGRYRIAKELGRGAMGRVFLAHDPEIDRNVAIKTIQIFASLPEEERAEARARFLREARAAGKLLHPGIVTVFDVGEANGAPYLAMELVEGTTLDAYCRAGNLLPVETVVPLVANVAEALAYAHGQGVVHRDIKPANLMRVGDTAVKIMDFGLARHAETQVTQDGALLGTPSYMSPEQIRGLELDGRSDLFSLAAVLYEMLTGEKAFGGESVSSVIFRVVNDDPRDAAEAHPRVPAELARFLRRALDKEPARRFADGRTFAAALRDAARAGARTAASASAATARAEPVPEAQLPPPPALRRRRRARRPWLGVLLVLLVGAAAGAVYVYREPLLELVRPAPEVVWLEARVRTDPPGLPVTLDGEPLDGDVVRFAAQEPYGLLEVRQACRTASHRLAAASAGGEIVLVPDPVEVELSVDPGVAGAAVLLNGKRAGVTPARLAMNLCRENRIELSADGYRPAAVVLAAGVSPMEARTQFAALDFVSIPLGRLVLPATSTPVRFLVDGEVVRRRGADGIELREGTHRVRAVNEDLWIDVTWNVEVQGGETVTPELAIPGIAEMVVQAFPANCKVFLRREGQRWKYVDDTPMRRRIAAGRYEVKVRLNPTGEERVEAVELRPGANPPIRISFGRTS